MGAASGSAHESVLSRHVLAGSPSRVRAQTSPWACQLSDCFFFWWSEGIFLVEVFGPFDLLLYGGIVRAMLGDVSLQLHSSRAKGLIR